MIYISSQTFDFKLHISPHGMRFGFIRVFGKTINFNLPRWTAQIVSHLFVSRCSYIIKNDMPRHFFVRL